MGTLRNEATKRTLMNVREFAECLSVTTSCVRRWLLEGRIVKVKLGRLVRIPSEERDRLTREGLPPARDEETG